MTKEDVIQEIEKLTMPERIEIVTTVVGNMSVLGVADLVKDFEEKFGVKAAAAMAPVAAAPGAGGNGAAAAAPEEEKFEFNVLLKEFGPKKIEVIKVVRELTGLGLKEAKDLVEAAPKAVKEGVAKDEANAAATKLRDVGAVVDVV